MVTLKQYIETSIYHTKTLKKKNIFWYYEFRNPMYSVIFT